MKGTPSKLSKATLLAAALAIGCDQSSSNMGAQPKEKPDSASMFFSDGASARPLVAGTIARDSEPASPTTMPFLITRDRIDHGQEAFNISCSVCHGRLGNGDGMIVRRGFTQPPSLHTQRLVVAPDSHIFDVITNGYGAMFPYGNRVPVETRWEIIAYIRALQAAGAQANVSAADRATLLLGGDPNHGMPAQKGRP